MATYGDIRFALTKQVPGVDPEIWDGFVMDMYQQILDRMNWQRLRQVFTIQTPVEVNGGTLTATLGDQTVLSDIVAAPLWSTALNGRMIRIENGPEYYQFTYQSTDPVTGFAVGLLDRPYEAGGLTDSDLPIPLTGPGLGYQINQNIYPMPPAVRLVEAVRNLDRGWSLNRITQTDLDDSEGQRGDYGDPAFWLPTFDQQSNPPVQQIEIYPVPQYGYGLSVEVVSEDVTFGAPSPGGAPASSSTAQVWMRPSCIKAGARALMEAHLKDFTAAGFWMAQFEKLLSQMVNIDSTRLGAQKMRMADRFTRHRIYRAMNQTPQVRLLP